MKIYERDKKIGFTRTYTVNPDMVISEPVQCGVCDTEHPNGKLLAFGVECTMETESMLLHFRNLMVNQQTEDTLEVL